MRERKPVIGVTCNFDYRDAVGMVSGMGITGQDWDFVSGDYVYILEKAGAIPVLLPQYGDLEAAKPFLDQLDGVLISGGHDVGPERYGAFPKGYCGTIMPMRDEQDCDFQIFYAGKEKADPRDLPWHSDHECGLWWDLVSGSGKRGRF